ncbi:MAG: DUF1963 domain-containing protein [Hyphomicrobiaceae bacterium]|nr:DUF1963 domain-containing protein [Hyphomicrobiaceae bacterium]
MAWNEWKDRLARTASVMELAARPPSAAASSCFGRVGVAAPGESWPTWRDKPLWPLCQLDLREAGYRPPILADLTFLALFIAGNYWEGDFPYLVDPGSGDAATWGLRAYTAVDGLVALPAPDHGTSPRPASIRWSTVSNDYPAHDMLPNDMPCDLRESTYEQDWVVGHHASKLGGWPSCVQSEPWWWRSEPDRAEFECAFQIDTEDEAHWMWGDSGTAYVARSQARPNTWAFDWQCY